MAMMQEGIGFVHLLIHAHYQPAAMTWPSQIEQKQKTEHGMIFPPEIFTWFWHVRDF